MSSLDNLYKNFNSSVSASQEIDLLGSEVGGSLQQALQPLPPVQSTLGMGWKVREGKISDRRLTRRKSQAVVKEVSEDSDSESESESGGLYSQPTSGPFWVGTQGMPQKVTYKLRTVYVFETRSFTLDGKINEDVQFFAHFWDSQGELHYYLIFAFKDSAVREEFFSGVYYPEIYSHHLSRPRVLVFSHDTPSVYGMNWPAGAYLLLEVEFGANLRAAASGTQNPLRFAGELKVLEDQYFLQMISWPPRTLTFGGGRAVLENVRLHMNTKEWQDEGEPRTIEGAPPEEKVLQPNPHDAQFGLTGNLRLSDTESPVVWTTLPVDTGVACWRLDAADVKLPSTKLLDGLLGEQKWLEDFPDGLQGWLLKDFVLTVDLPRREILYCSYVLEGTASFENIADSTFEVPDARISCTVTFPGRVSRTESVEVEGEVTLYNTKFELREDKIEKIVHLNSADGQGFDLWRETSWYKIAHGQLSFDEAEIQQKFDQLHVRIDMKTQLFWISVSNGDGESRSF